MGSQLHSGEKAGDRWIADPSYYAKPRREKQDDVSPVPSK